MATIEILNWILTKLITAPSTLTTISSQMATNKSNLNRNMVMNTIKTSSNTSTMNKLTMMYLSMFKSSLLNNKSKSIQMSTTKSRMFNQKQTKKRSKEWPNKDSLSRKYQIWASTKTCSPNFCKRGKQVTRQIMHSIQTSGLLKNQMKLLKSFRSKIKILT